MSNHLTFNTEFIEYEPDMGIDDEIDIYENNLQQIKHLEKELVELNDLFKEFGELVIRQGEDINEVEECVVATEDCINEGVGELHEADNQNSDTRSNFLHVIGGGIIGGAAFGGIGAIFGAIPALLGTGIGLGAGGITGAAVKQAKD